MATELSGDTNQQTGPPKLLEIDPLHEAIFIYISEINLINDHDIIMVNEYKKNWELQPIIIVFDMHSSLNSDKLLKFIEILEHFEKNVTTIVV